MAAPDRRTDRSLEDLLFDSGYDFDFFQAVRLLAQVSPGRKPVGGTSRPQEEFVRFGAHIDTAFPPSAIHEILHIPDSPHPVRMTVAFLGLTGIQGVMPLCYTDWMIERIAAKDPTVVAFFDLFNHRLLSLFYRSWEKHRPPVLYELGAARKQGPDLFTHCLLGIIGMGTDHLRGRMRVDDESLLRYAGLISQQPHSASALRGIVRDYFSVPVQIDQFVGDWYTLEGADRCYLSDELERNQLEIGAFLGDAVWNQQGRFRICLGPLRFDRFREFLPDGLAMPKLVELTRYLVGQAVAFEVQVSLQAPEVPYCRLSDEGADAPRLGWVGWLKTGAFVTDADDAVFEWVN